MTRFVEARVKLRDCHEFRAKVWRTGLQCMPKICFRRGRPTLASYSPVY